MRVVKENVCHPSSSEATLGKIIYDGLARCYFFIPDGAEIGCTHSYMVIDQDWAKSLDQTELSKLEEYFRSSHRHLRALRD